MYAHGHSRFVRTIEDLQVVKKLMAGTCTAPQWKQKLGVRILWQNLCMPVAKNFC